MEQLEIWEPKYKVAYKEYIEIYENNKFKGYDHSKCKYYITKGLMTLPRALEFSEFISTMTWAYAGWHKIIEQIKKPT